MARSAADATVPAARPSTLASRRWSSHSRGAALLRLTACVLIEAHDEWAAGDRRYLSEASMAALNGINVVSLPTGISAVDANVDTGAAVTA